MLDTEMEKYQSLVYDKANEIEVDPLLIDYIVSLLATGCELIERKIIIGYFVRLATSIIEDAETGLRSHRQDLADTARRYLETIDEGTLSILSPGDRGVLHINVSLMDGDGEIKYAHLKALNEANEQIEAIKAKYNFSDFADLITRRWSKQFAKLVEQYRTLERLASRETRKGQKPRAFKKRRRK